MTSKGDLRHTISATIIIAYLAPILFFSGYATTQMSLDKSWTFLMGGLLLAVCGACFLILKMWQWEQRTWAEIDTLGFSRKSTFTPASFAAQQDVTDLYEEEDPIEAVEDLPSVGPSKLELELEASIEEILSLKKLLEETSQLLEEETNERISLQKQIEQLKEEFSFYQESSREQLNQKDEMLGEYVQAMSELRGNMENKQQKISKLQSSVDDLTYEVKTLLQISDFEAPKPRSSKSPSSNTSPFVQGSLFSPEKVTRPEPEPTISDQKVSQEQIQAGNQLKRCIDLAQKITGASHFEVSKVQEWSPGSFTIDQRRLFDSLRSETEGLIIVYSPREDKILFANHMSKELLGYSSDRFTHDFFSLIQEGTHSWREAVQSLRDHQGAQAEIMVTARSGASMPLHCSLEVIPTGLFKGNVIGVLVPAISTLAR